MQVSMYNVCKVHDRSKENTSFQPGVQKLNF